MPRRQRTLVSFILYILVVLMVVAIVLGAKDGLPGWANDALGIGIVFFVFGSLALWVHLNTSALLDEEIERAKHDQTVAASSGSNRGPTNTASPQEQRRIDALK